MTRPRLKISLLVFALGLLIIGSGDFFPCYAASAGQKVKAGNKLYREGRPDAALEKYNEAKSGMPDSDILDFNTGAALYKKEDYQKAAEAFTKALTSDDANIEADALYNLGNCKYKMGKLKEGADLSGAAGLLKESLDYYKRAIEIDQKNTDARFNHEFVERELKILLDKLKQQQSNQDKQKDQQEQQEKQKQQEQQKQGTCPAGKEQAEGAKDKESEQKQQQEKEKETQGPLSRQEKDRQEEEQAGAEESRQEDGDKGLSPDEARSLLERYGRQEAQADYMDKHPRQGYDNEVSKDW